MYSDFYMKSTTKENIKFHKLDRGKNEREFHKLDRGKPFRI